MTRYRCVAARKAEGFTVVDACKAADVSRSAFYEWLARPEGPSDAEWDEAHLTDEIIGIHDESGGTYGEPRITAELRRRGHVVNHKRVARLMRDNGIVGHRPRKRRSLTKPDEGAAPLPDLVGRLFDPDEVDHTWAGDITYIPTDEGWLYLATVIDLASRRLIGYSMSTNCDTDLVADALKAAIATRGQVKMDGTIFHADRGTQYTSRAFRELCEQLGIRQSASRTGSCLDNAVAESFFASLKVECVNRVRYTTRAEARTSVFAWSVRYNRSRLHSTLGMRPPIEWETLHAAPQPPLRSEPLAA